MHPARKQLLHAYTCRLSEDSDDYLDKILEEAQSQKQGIRDFAKEQSARHKHQRAYETKNRSPSRSGLTEISKEVACLRSALMKVTKALFQDNKKVETVKEIDWKGINDLMYRYDPTTTNNPQRNWPNQVEDRPLEVIEEQPEPTEEDEENQRLGKRRLGK